jgi:predicted nucleic acid-binding protein
VARLYIDTSIVSYLRQPPSEYLVAAARNMLTRRWWEHERQEYELVTSQYVIDEAADGDTHLAGERLAVLEGIPLLELTPEIDVIAMEIMARSILPPKAQLDALHIAVAAYHRIDYLLTWNCKHIANARILPKIHGVLNDMECWIPIICTPEEMLDDEAY